MRLNRTLPLTLLVLSLLTLLTIPAFTASNVVAPSKISEIIVARTVFQFVPPECEPLNLSAIVTGAGAFGGTSTPELILGSSGADTIRGGGGSDCIYAGDGNDFLQGDGGGADVCFGQGGTDTFHSSCEFRIQ